MHVPVSQRHRHTIFTMFTERMSVSRRHVLLVLRPRSKIIFFFSFPRPIRMREKITTMSCIVYIAPPFQASKCTLRAYSLWWKTPTAREAPQTRNIQLYMHIPGFLYTWEIEKTTPCLCIRVNRLLTIQRPLGSPALEILPDINTLSNFQILAIVNVWDLISPHNLLFFFFWCVPT